MSFVSTLVRSESVFDPLSLLGFLAWNRLGLGPGMSSELSDDEQLFSEEETLVAEADSSSEELSMPSSLSPWKEVSESMTTSKILASI